MVVVLAIVALDFIVDPYRANRVFDLGLRRDLVSPVLNQRLWKLMDYDHDPRRRIVLGDSRCDRLKAEYFARAGMPGVVNLSVGGSTLSEVDEIYAFARRRTRLESVLVCVSFDRYNEIIAANRVPEVVPLVEHRAVYYLSPFVLQSSVAVLRQRITGYAKTGRPNMGRAEFLRYQLGPDVIGSSYGLWKRPDRQWARLESLARGCRSDGTSLSFVIPPNHVDLQASVDQYGLRAEYELHKQRLATLAPVVDFDFANAMTGDAEQYDDPFHAKPEVYERVVKELVRKTREISRRITPEAPSLPSDAAPDDPARRS